MVTLISREQDYGLRIVSLLASREENFVMPVSEIAKLLYISKDFAAQIVHKLKQKNIIEAKQGKYGGVFLAVNPEATSIFDVLVALPYKIGINKCSDPDFDCELEKYCKYHTYFLQLEKSMIKSMKEKMISDFLYKNI